MRIMNIALWYSSVVPMEFQDAFFEKVDRLRAQLKDIYGVHIIDDKQNVEVDIDIQIVLLDYCDAEFIRQIGIIFHCDAHLWCFHPRSVPIPSGLAELIHSAGCHSVNPYDDYRDVVRKVARETYDRSVADIITAPGDRVESHAKSLT